jgi:hypothetical protein
MAVQEVVKEEMESSRIVFRGNAVGAGIKPAGGEETGR